MSTLNWRGVSWFVGLAAGLGWLCCAPLWISGAGLQHPLAPLLMILMMFTPALATLIVTRWISPPPEGIIRATGLVIGRGRRWGWYWLFAWTVPALVMLVSPFVSALLGVYDLDLSLSRLREVLKAAGIDTLDNGSLWTILVSQLLIALIIGPLLNAIPVFGEEWGWRGYLLPNLLPLGQWPALIISGVIWGLWHAPIILLGYNYPTNPGLGVIMMTVFCVLVGILLGWTRLATGSVWPAVIGHGSLNAFGGLIVLFARASSTVDTIWATALGLTGWPLWLIIIALLVLMRRLPVADSPDTHQSFVAPEVLMVKQ
ncbi:MAG: CPBP family intramembrane metalloprotease [Chloroflexus sp.]|nr:CPBP family intramembrane metalloprotease [Chloroflexus sp.]MBO9372796.1 CPBP family intramembrane metalloprotease [Chloroflexus sp.]